MDSWRPQGFACSNGAGTRPRALLCHGLHSERIAEGDIYQAATGDTPKFFLFENDDVGFTKVASGTTYDIVHPCAYRFQDYVNINAVQPWDTSLIPNFSQLNPELEKQGNINGQQYFIVEDWGFIAPLYRAAGLGPAAGWGWYFADKAEPICESMDRLGAMPFVAQPGERFVYGYNTDILGCVVERVSGMPLDPFLRTRVFGPLRMSDTYFFLPPAQRGRLAAVYAATPGGAIVRADEGPLGPQLGATPRYDARALLTAGTVVGAPTLLRFYVLHCIVLPLVASALMMLHFWRVRKDGGISGPL